MSYDVDAATHERPTPPEPPEGVTVDGPFEVEPADLADALAAAVLAPRWLVQVSGTKRDVARRFGRELAQAAGGAAYDRQEDAVYFPRGTPKRVPAGKAAKTSIVELEWTVAEWDRAPAALIDVLRRHAREGLPRRYGDYEPPQHRFEDPVVFAAFARATSAEAYAERHWRVSANNRLSIDGKWVGRDHRGPAWLEWDGALTRHGELPRERYPLSRRWRSALKSG